MKKTIITLIATVLLFNFFSACSANYSNEDTIKEFLSTFYEVPNQKIAMDNIAYLDSQADETANVNFLCERFQKYFTEDAFLTFLVYPNWMHGYRIAATNGLTRIADGLSLEKKNDENYVFNLNVTETNTKTGSSVVVFQKGEITMKNGKISDITFEDISSLFPSPFNTDISNSARKEN